MRLSRRLVVFVSVALAAVSSAAALTVNPLIDRVLKAEDGRSVDARIVDVTAGAVTLVRREDAVRFTLSLDRLSEEDRTFLNGLYRELLANQPLPDTPFLQLVRKDFVRATADRKKTEPLAADAFSRDRWILIVVHEYFSSPHFPWVGPNQERDKLHELPVLWLLVTADALQVELAADTLPERHALLSARAARMARDVSSDLYDKAANDSIKRNPPKSGEVWYPFADEAAEIAFEKRVLARVPGYWPRLPFGPFNTRRRDVMPYACLYRRDGSPAILRGHPVRGDVHEVVAILRKHEAELE
jgi:hypothetical protein